MNRGQQIVIPSIRMGEMSVARDGDPLRTLLGSCVGLAFYDQSQCIGGLAHIVLPDSRGQTDQPGKFVDTAIPLLLHKMREIGDTDLQLTAKLAGGASMFPQSVASEIGVQNIESCERILAELGIPVMARHCGGRQGRRMSLDTENGNVLVEIVGQPPIQI
ncbi:MAG: chemotaxis protein CheD [Pirellulaceae bacterium]